MYYIRTITVATIEKSASEYASSLLALLTRGASMEIECRKSADIFSRSKGCHEIFCSPRYTYHTAVVIYDFENDYFQPCSP